ncbi:hypothetical protein ACODT3_10700 [Streptomyces sp. 4.24]|uniref:hypothetical protein n=1 Tax=Streptomyces tritrimontium TaxID=3406573 RepID=UPI003BB5063E
MPVIHTKHGTTYDTDRMTERDFKNAIRRLDDSRDFDSDSMRKLEKAMAKRGFSWDV